MEDFDFKTFLKSMTSELAKLLEMLARRVDNICHFGVSLKYFRERQFEQLFQYTCFIKILREKA